MKVILCKPMTLMQTPPSSQPTPTPPPSHHPCTCTPVISRMGVIIRPSRRGTTGDLRTRSSSSLCKLRIFFAWFSIRSEIIRPFTLKFRIQCRTSLIYVLAMLSGSSRCSDDVCAKHGLQYAAVDVAEVPYCFRPKMWAYIRHQRTRLFET